MTEIQTFKISPGPGAVVAEVEGIRVSFLTCFEIYFPEYVERVASLSPDVVIFPSYQRSEESEVIRKQVMGRALDLEAFILRASYSMGENSLTGGCSMIVNPRGRIILNARQRTGLFTRTINPKEKRPHPQAHGLGIMNSRQITEDFRKPELYRPAGPSVARKDFEK